MHLEEQHEELIADLEHDIASLFDPEIKQEKLKNAQKVKKLISKIEKGQIKMEDIAKKAP